MTRTTEAILGYFEHPVLEELGLLAVLNPQVTVSVNHVLEFVRARHLAGLGHLAHHNGDGVVFLAVVRDHLK